MVFFHRIEAVLALSDRTLVRIWIYGVTGFRHEQYFHPNFESVDQIRMRDMLLILNRPNHIAEPNGVEINLPVPPVDENPQMPHA